MFSSSAALCEDFIKSEGEFMTESGDSVELIKQQLLFEGFLDAVIKKVDSLGLNKDLFVQKYDEKLYRKYDALDKRLKEKYKIDDSTSSAQIKNYVSELRDKKLIVKRKHENMRSLILSYVIKKMSRSPQNANLRVIKMEVKVNEKNIIKKYYELTRGKLESDFGSLYLYTRYNLKNITYSDFGIKNEKDFTGVIQNNWIEWLTKNKAENISNVESLSDDGIQKINELEKLPIEKAFKTIPSEFKNSLLLDVSVDIDKRKFNSRFNEYEFSYTAQAFLRDIQSGLIIGEYNLGEDLKTYRVEKGVSLVNLVANHIYRMVSGHFPKINRAIKDFPPIKNIEKLSISGFKNVDEITSLLELIRTKGVKYSMKAMLVSFSKVNAEAVIYYDGTLPELKAHLNTIKSAKSDLNFNLIETDSGVGIKLN